METHHGLADAMPLIVWTHGTDGAVTYFNRHWTEYTGLTLAQTIEAGAESLVHPDDREVVAALFLSARTATLAKPFTATYRLRRKDGAYRWHEAMVAPLALAEGKTNTFVGTATDVDDRVRAHAEQAFLIEATRVLGTSLDVDKTLADVASLVVPKLADWCAIDLLVDGGQSVRRAAVAHVDPSKLELANEIVARAPARPDDPHGVFAVIRSRTTEHLASIDDDLLVKAVGGDAEVLRILRGLGLRSSVCVPLIARDHVVGALTLVAAESGNAYGARDVAFAEEFARRISIALDNARLYEEATRARRAAEALAADVLEQSKSVEAALLAMRQDRDAALARLGSTTSG